MTIFIINVECENRKFSFGIILNLQVMHTEFKILFYIEGHILFKYFNFYKICLKFYNCLILSRMAAERDLEKSEAINLANIVFDESGNFVMYATMLGVKVVNLHTNRCVRMVGKPENLRLLQLALFQVFLLP